MSRTLGLAALAIFVQSVAFAQTTIPTTVPIHGDDFESGSLEDWFISGTGTLGLAPGDGVGGSAAMAVTLSADEAHLLRGNRRDVARADEAYLTFSFDPNSANFNDPGSGFIPNRAIQIGVIRGPDDGVLVALRVREVAPGSYEGFLHWLDDGGSQQYDFSSGSFSLDDSWQEITLGFRVDDWVSCWVDGTNVRSVTGVTHLEPYASQIEAGKANSPPLIPTPVGELRFDDVSLGIPTISDLWVDAATGDDAHDGLTPGTAFATVSRAADLATAGTTVHIQPGIYREEVVPAQGGLPADPVVFRAEGGLGTVRIRGSEPTSSLSWTQLVSDTIGLPAGVDPASVWWADLSSWALDERPDFIVSTDAASLITDRLPPAREPDWQVTTPYRYSDFWWIANGGSSIAGCDPSAGDDECDLGSRSTLQLTDTVDETSPSGIEAGNLTSLGSLIGATAVARDAYWGHRLFTRSVVGHNVAQGRITLDLESLESDGDPGLGWGTQYYVENHPALIDSPGEWWFDAATDRLYLWPATAGDPAGQNLEISRRDHAFDLANRSYVHLEDLDLEAVNEALISIQNLHWLSSRDLLVSGCKLHYGEQGVLASQTVVAGEHEDKVIDGLTFEGNTFSAIDHDAIRVTSNWDDSNDPEAWVRLATTNVQILSNTFSDIGFRPPQGTAGINGAIWIWWGDNVTIEDNQISNTAQDGMKIFRSVIQSANEWGFSPSEIKTGSILIKDNLVEQACLLKNDCGAILFEGSHPDQHVFREVLVVGNTLREVLGWSWAAEQRGLWTAGQIKGGGGIGVYMGNTSNIHIYRNILYSNSFAGVHLAERWRDGEIYIYNNTSTDNAFGVHFGGTDQDTHDDVDTQVQGNLFVNNEAYGVKLSNLETTYPATVVDHNLYFNNGWGGTVFKPGVFKISHGASSEYFQTISELRAGTPFEDSGQEADPTFLDYDISDHSLLDGSRPDFRLVTGSPAIDAGPAALPTALASLLTQFGIVDPPQGSAYDQGAIEGAIDCDDLTVSGVAVDSPTTFQACDVLTLGPDLVVESTGELTAIAGNTVLLTNGVTLNTGATLEAQTGVFP